MRELRLEAALTQEEVSYRTKLDQTYISGIERGRRNPTLWVVWRLAEGMGTTPGRLIQVAEGRMASD